jgi:ribosomal protein L19E
MARKKDQDMDTEDYMEVARQLRATMVTIKEDNTDTRQAFHKFFIKIKEKLNLKPEMEIVLWKHLQATENDKPEKFAEGVRSFGYNLN